MKSRTIKTFEPIQVSQATFDEIAKKLRGRKAHHTFVDDDIDMTGYGITVRSLSTVERTKPLIKPPDNSDKDADFDDEDDDES